jgi:hypothetical protein
MMSMAIFAVILLAAWALVSVAANSKQVQLAGASLATAIGAGTSNAPGGRKPPLRGLVNAFSSVFDLPATDGKSWGPVDANLQFMAAQTLAASGDGTKAIDLGPNFAAAPFRQTALFLRVAAVLFTTGGAQSYKVEVFESDDGLTNWTTTGLYANITAAGDLLKLVGVTKEFVKLTWTISAATGVEADPLKVGASASITADAYLIPALNT